MQYDVETEFAAFPPINIWKMAACQNIPTSVVKLGEPYGYGLGHPVGLAVDIFPVFAVRLVRAHSGSVAP
jgi:hypothetical protein